MSSDGMKSGRMVLRVPVGALFRALQSARRDMRELGRLARKARERLRASPDVRGKLDELAWMARTAGVRLGRRFGVAQKRISGPPAQQRVREIARAAQRTLLSGIAPVDVQLPNCVLLDGAVVISLPSEQTSPKICFRDGNSNLHQGAILEQFPAETAGGVRFLVQIPPDIDVSNGASVDVIVRLEGEQLVFAGLRIHGRPSLALKTFTFENSLVRFAFDRAGDGGGPVGLGLFIDGAPGATCSISASERSVTGTMPVDHCFFDGRAHLMELRELPGLSKLGQIYEILPLHLTPWNALQLHARPPLDGSLAEQARHHFVSYREWFERSRTEAPGRIPALGELYTELCQGFRKRPSYPRIEFEKQPQPLVSVVIPVRNRCEVSYHCLCSLLFAFNETPFEVIVVDDSSSDETCRLHEFVGGVDILRLEAGAGFVNACNKGVARAKGDFVVLLNNDTEVTARWIDELVAAFRDFDRVGLAGSKLVYPDGRLQEAGGVIWGSGNPWNVGRDANPNDPRYNYLRKVDYVSGAALMIPRQLWHDVAGFSEEFSPGYFEDTDLAMKVREAGYHVVYVPTSTVYHFEGQTAGNSVAAGMKSFQEVNRPKFLRKWSHAYRHHRREGEALDREKDRDVAFRVLFIDHQFPLTDMDAGSYAAFQEIRLFQALGAKVTFLPRNLAWMDRHTVALQRVGVECLYAPYVMNFSEYVRSHSSEYDIVYVNRYKIAEHVLPLVRSVAPRVKVAFNLADLHFLRELREAAANSPGYSRASAEKTRRAEVAAIRASDLTFSYSDVELAIIRDVAGRDARLAKMPWVVDCMTRTVSFADTRDILFLGGFGHPPNLQAAKFFAREVMPLLCERLPDVHFNIVGNRARVHVPELNSDRVRVLGYVPDLTEHLSRARVFVAPLFAGAGVKGKVLDALSHGLPCVLSPVAAEGTGLQNGNDCLIANSAREWADCVERLYTNEQLWNRISENALTLAQMRYAFAGAVAALEPDLAMIGIQARKEWGLVYGNARPQRFSH